MNSKPSQKYIVGDLVYFVGLDNRCQWAVFGTTVAAVHKQGSHWIYDLNASPFWVRRDESGVYRDYAAAKVQAELNNQYNQISPKRGGRKASYRKTTTYTRPSLF